MSVSLVKKQIFTFLETNKPEVLAIKGTWGVGKTFSWNAFLKEASENKRIGLSKYSYVSLFGINNLDKLKYTIFENVISKEMIGQEASLKTLKDNTTSLVNILGRKTMGFLKGAPGVGEYVSSIDSLAFLSLKDTIVCIDDFERKSNDLDTKDVLGLVSLLKEQKKCKVVLILNDATLCEETEKDYRKYREKVIDMDMKFAPNAKEAIDIAFSMNAEYHEELKKCCVKLEINNIRILKRIERLCDLLYVVLKDYDAAILRQAIHSTTLYTWCYLNHEELIPTLEYLKSFSYTLYGLGNEDNDEKKRKWDMLLRSYNYTNTDELDLVIMDAIKVGYIDEEKLVNEALRKQEMIESEKTEESFKKAWGLYHDTFKDNKSEVIDGLYQSFLENVKNISPINVSGTACLFRDLGEDDKANELIEYYINERSSEVELFNLRSYPFKEDLKDSIVIEKFEAKYSSSIKSKSLKEVIASMAVRNGWNRDDEVVLASANVDELYDLFMKEEGDNLDSYVRVCTQFCNIRNASENQKRIDELVTATLNRIGNESLINRRRVRKFGIKID